MTANNPSVSSTAPDNAATGNSVSSRWVQFNRALAASASGARRPGLDGRWKPSDRVVIPTIA